MKLISQPNTKNVKSIIGGAKSLCCLGWITIAGAVLPWGVTVAQAAEAPSKSAAPTSGGIVGIGLASVAKYQGADHSDIKAIPILDYHWSNGLFVGGENEALLGFRAAGPSQSQYGVALGVDKGRKDYSAGALAGMGSIATRGVLLAFAQIPLTDQLSFDSSLKYGAGDDKKGGLIKLGANYRVALDRSTQLSFNVGAVAANSSYMGSYFGVSAAQARTSAYHVYTPSGGLRDISLGAHLYRQMSRDYSVMVGAGVTRFSDGVERSPLVKRSITPAVFVGVARTFSSL